MPNPQLDLLPSIQLKFMIIRFLKGYYRQDPSVYPEDAKRLMAMQCQDPIDGKQLELSPRLLGMVKAYLDLCQLMACQKIIDSQQPRLLLDKCPLFMEIHEVFQLSDFCNDRVRGPSTQPATTVGPSTDTSTVDEEGSNEEDKGDFSMETYIVDTCTEPSPKLEKDIAKYMKNYFKKNPTADKSQLLSDMNFELSLNWEPRRLRDYVRDMLRRYREAHPLIYQKDRDIKLAAQGWLKCHFFYEVDDALQLSDVYRPCNWSLEMDMMSSDESEDLNSSGETNIDIDHQRPTEEEAQLLSTLSMAQGESVTVQAAKPVDRHPEPTRPANQDGEEEPEWLIKLKTRIARAVRDHFKENPSSKPREMKKAVYKQLNVSVSEYSFRCCVHKMIKNYLEVRQLIGDPDAYCIRKKLFALIYPYFDLIHEAVKYSDHYREYILKLDRRRGSCPHLMTTVESTSKDDETHSRLCGVDKQEVDETED